MNPAEPSASFVILINTASLILFLCFVLLPFAGYWFMYVDFRAYLRALQRALVVISQAPQYVVPEWAKHQDPPYFRALGVRASASEEEIKHAYRRLAEQMHPDRGGDRKRFLALREHLDHALAHIRSDSRSV